MYGPSGYECGAQLLIYYMKTRKRQNTGAGREGLTPRKKGKEEYESVRGSNPHWCPLADGLQQETGVHTPQGNDPAVKRSPLVIYWRAEEAPKHGWERSLPVCALDGPAVAAGRKSGRSSLSYLSPCVLS
jgi:hypothetical protein